MGRFNEYPPPAILSGDEKIVVEQAGSTWSSPISRIINDLGVVYNSTIIAPVNGQVLTYSNGNWINANTAFSTLTPEEYDVLSYTGGSWTNRKVNLTELGDVTITSAVTNNVLFYSGTEWINSPISLYELSQLTIGTPQVNDVIAYQGSDTFQTITPSIEHLSEVTLIAPEAGDALTYDGSQWSNPVKSWGLEGNFIDNVTNNYYVEYHLELPDGIQLVQVDSGNIYRSVDDGNTWQEIKPDPSVTYSLPLITNKRGEMVLIYFNDVYKSVDSGMTWTHTTFEGNNTIGPNSYDTDGENVIICRRFSTIDSIPYVYRTDDFGDTWELITVDGTATISGGDCNVFWLGGTRWVRSVVNTTGTGAISTDGGLSWNIRTDLDGFNSSAVVSPNRKVIMTESTTNIVVSHDGLETNTTVPVGLGGNVRDIFFVTDYLVFCTNFSNTDFARSEDGGLTWEVITGTSNRQTFFSGGRNGVVVSGSYYGEANISYDGGKTWSSLPMTGTEDSQGFDGLSLLSNGKLYIWSESFIDPDWCATLYSMDNLMVEPFYPRTEPFTSSSVNINTLSDVDTDGVTTGQILIYDSGTWINGDVATTVEGLTDVTLTDIVDGQILIYSSGSWINGDMSGGSADLSDVAEDILPSTTDTYDVGSDTHRWEDFHYSGVIYKDGTALTPIVASDTPPTDTTIFWIDTSS
jgi:hypothetical protein